MNSCESCNCPFFDTVSGVCVKTDGICWLYERD